MIIYYFYLIKIRNMGNLENKLNEYSLELTRVSNNDLLAGLSALGAESFKLLHDIHPVDDASKDNVLSVKP